MEMTSLGAAAFSAVWTMSVLALTKLILALAQ
jgi:hypothetical protein